MNNLAEHSELTSAFNEGALQIQRLHYLWINVNQAREAGNNEKWRWRLDAVWAELSRDAVRIAGKFNPEEFDKLKDNTWFKTHNKLLEAVKEANTKKGEDLYVALNELEIFLRILQDAAGKGGRYKDPHDDEID